MQDLPPQSLLAIALHAFPGEERREEGRPVRWLAARQQVIEV